MKRIYLPSIRPGIIMVVIPQRNLATCVLIALLMTVVAESSAADIFNTMNWNNINTRTMYRSMLKERGYTTEQLNHMTTNEMLEAIAREKQGNTSRPQPPDVSPNDTEDFNALIDEAKAAVSLSARRYRASVRPDLQNLQSMAEQGDAEAQYRLAEEYLYQQPDDPDSKAFDWMRRAADQGHMNAQIQLGRLYYRGDGRTQDVNTTQDFKQAVFWYRKAAEQGSKEAPYRLSEMYDAGFGVPKDMKVASEWLHKSAERGYTLAQVVLGLQYAKGKGVPKDHQQAVAWMSKAAKQADDKFGQRAAERWLRKWNCHYARTTLTCLSVGVD